MKVCFMGLLTVVLFVILGWIVLAWLSENTALAKAYQVLFSPAQASDQAVLIISLAR